MTAAVETLQVTENGVYEISNVDYHADPVPGGSLSSTGARKLLAPSCPAIFAYERDNPPPPKDTFDIGHAAHDMVLGGGPEIVRLEHPNLLTKAAKADRDEARARGAVPVLAHVHDEIQAMAEAVLAHPIARKLFEPGTFTPEASLFLRDEDSGVMLRGRLDGLPGLTGDRMIIPDLKTAKSAEPSRFVRSVVDYGYHCQDDWYSRLATGLGLADEARVVFVVVEKTPPYVVSVIQLDVVARRIGAAMNRAAINTYAECTRTGIWPGYVDDVALASLPRWYETQHEEDFS